jgi:hypothetical protein
MQNKKMEKFNPVMIIPVYGNPALVFEKIGCLGNSGLYIGVSPLGHVTEEIYLTCRALNSFLRDGHPNQTFNRPSRQINPYLTQKK